MMQDYISHISRQPKERRKKSISHDPSVKLAKRHFAAQEAAVEKVEIGSLEDVPVCLHSTT